MFIVSQVVVNTSSTVFQKASCFLHLKILGVPPHGTDYIIH